MSATPGTPATPTLLRDLNERTVLEAIRAGAPISRAEISRRVGISKPTVSIALESLVDAGLVREAADHGAGLKYGATFFEPVHEAALVLGLDLGARFLRGAICDLRGTVRARQDIEMPGADVHAVVDAAAGLRDRLIAACDLPAGALDGAVAGVPGVIEAPEGAVGLAGNIPGLEGLPIGAVLERRLDVPVQVENDVNLAAVGEHWRGVGQGVDDFVFLSVGTGLGAGLVLRGELHRGHHGAAGEVDFALGGDLERENDPAADGVVAFAAELAAHGGAADVARSAVRRAGDLQRRAGRRPARPGGRRRGGAPDRAARRPDRRRRRRRPDRPRRRDRRQRRPAAGADPRAPRRALPLPPARRGLEPRGRGRAHRRARDRAARGARQRVHQPQPTHAEG